MWSIFRATGILVGVFFLFAGGTKLLGWPPHPEHFAAWGYPDWFRLFVGVWEVGFGALFLFPRLQVYGGAGLGLDMLGSVYTHLSHGEIAQSVVPLLILAIVALLAWGPRRPAD